jgi:hypothetical protein
MSQSLVQNEVLHSRTVEPNVQLYGIENLEAIPWSSSPENEKARLFFSALIKQGVQQFIDNENCQIKLLSLNNQLIPITINDEQSSHSFACSPYTHYVSYSYIILNGLKNKLLKGTLNRSLNVYGSFLKKGKIDKVVIVNNWLFTTTPHLVIDPANLESLVRYLTSQFPDHAILFRSVTPEVSPDFYKALKQNDFQMIASRLVYITHTDKDEIFHTRIFKSDLKLLKEASYTVVPQEELKEAELEKIIELYRALYIEKYSNLNPQFNVNYLKLALQSGVLHLTAVRQNSEIEGAFGYFYQNGVMISPFFGYDPLKTEKKGVYRILSTLLMLEAQKKKALYNQSAGGSFFKKIRRAEGHFEYTAVYYTHLPYWRRLRWQVLKGIMNSAGAQYMKRY